MPENAPATRDLTRILLSTLLIALMTLGSLWVLRPFLAALIWAAMIVIPTWPLLLALQARLGGKRSMASLIMILGMLLVIVIPLGAAITTLTDSADTIRTHVTDFLHGPLPAPPEWLHAVPVVGERAAAAWQDVANAGTAGLRARLAPHINEMLHWLLAEAGNFGSLAVHFLLMLIIAALLYVRGETAAAGVIRFARRLAGDQGEAAATLAGRAIRAVALGVVVTAAAQSVVGGIALASAAYPAPDCSPPSSSFCVSHRLVRRSSWFPPHYGCCGSTVQSGPSYCWRRRWSRSCSTTCCGRP